MEIIRYVNRAMIMGLKNYNLNLTDFIEGSDLEKQEQTAHRDSLFTRDIPIKIIIPDENKD